MENTQQIAQLLRDYLQGELSEADEALLKAWVDATPDNRHMLNSLQNQDQLINGLKSWNDLWGDPDQERQSRITNHIKHRITEPTVGKANRRLIKWTSYAAAIIAAVTIAFFFLNRTGEGEGPEQAPHAADLAPGGNRAVLQLADGSIIDLSEDQEGITVGNGIHYLDGSTVMTPGAGSGLQKKATGGVQYAQLSTPNGGTYQITLPDGSKVWLNAASTLRYPLQFEKDARIVELTGEGYFEVTRDTNHPFKVRSNGQEIEVLGTSFNISAYPEYQTQTTLVTGKVSVRPVNSQRSGMMTVLNPGQQSTIEGDRVTVEEVYLPAVIAWKDGLFNFTGKTLNQVLDELGRWYDFKVEYETSIGNDKFYGELYRNSRLATVLEALRYTRVKFRIEEKTNINGTMEKTMIVY